MKSKTKARTLYRAFVDGLVQRRRGVLADWVATKGWPRLPENRPLNRLLAKLTTAERELLATVAEQARDGGIHDTLAYLQDLMDRSALRIHVNGIELPVSPYDSELFYDWRARVDGQEWPKD